MPKRDRNHELETESQRAFENSLPASVVVRPVSDDYGIDREVEVFVDGLATGLTFKVQLKGTDGSGEVRRVKRDSVDYWQSLDVPVLLVSYEASSGTLRTRWAHSLGADRPLGNGKTVSVHMTDTWSREFTTAEALANDLRLIRQLKRGDVPNPIPLVVTTTNTMQASPSTLASQILVMSRSTAAPLRLAGPEEAAVTIDFDDNRVTAALPFGVASGSFRAADGQFRQIPVAALAELGLLLTSMTLSPIDETRARELLRSVADDSPWWSVNYFFERCAQLLNHPSSAAQLFGVHAALLEADDEAALGYSAMLQIRARDLQADEFDQYIRHIQATLSSKRDGQLTFSIASLCRHRGDHRLALQLFDQAAAQDPGYLADVLFLRFVGASSWELGEYERSVDCYEQALALGYDPYELRPLLADSLMYAGRYEDARSILDEWSPRGERSDKSGVLRVVMLDYLLGVVGVSLQRRAEPDAATKAAYWMARDRGTSTGDQLLQLMRDFDALDPYPLSELAAHPDNAGAFEPSLLCAFMMERDAHRWAIALAVALTADAAEDVLRALTDQARYLCDASFFDAAIDLSASLQPEPASRMRSLVEAAYTAEPEVFEHRIRLIGPGETERVLDEITTPMSPNRRV